MGFFRRGWRGGALAFLALLLSAGSARQALAVDDVVFNSANGHYYKYVSGTSTWAQSKTGALALNNGYLATFSDAAEIQWVLGAFSMGTVGVWIGGSDNGSEGAWYWANGEPWVYSNWNALEPNNSGTEDYLMMYVSGTAAGKWNDAPTNYTLPGYLVEWSGDPNPPPPPVFPAAPSGLMAALSFQSTILLNWTDNSANETSFEVQRKPIGGAFAPLATLGADTEALEDTEINPLTDYTYRVRAVNIVGPSTWSNEASTTSGTYSPAPLAPSDLLVVDTTAGTADLQWTDNSNGETGFEIHRRTGNGTLAFLFKTGPDAVSYHDAGVKPDQDYGYAVRSVGTVRVSGFIQAATTTLPTLVVGTVKGDLKDSAKFGKDSLKATASWAYIDGVSDGEANPVTEGITVRAGTASSPVVLTLPPNAEGWKGKGAKWKWKNPAGSTTKYQVQVDLDKRLVTVSAVGLQLAVPPANPVRFSVAIGDDAGTENRDWAVQKKPGYLKLR